VTDLVTLQAQLEQLKYARRQGATTIGYEGKTISYKSDAEMMQAIGSLETEIAMTQGSPRQLNVSVRSKGWY
jgi:hypothetical protein